MENGQQQAGYVLVTVDKVVEDQPLTVETSAQMSEP